MSSTQIQDPQLPPFPYPLGVLESHYSTESTTVVLKQKLSSWSGNDFSIKTLAGQPLMKVEGKAISLSRKIRVTDMQDKHLFTLRQEPWSIRGRYYAEGPTGMRFLNVDGHISFGGKKSTISFLNASNGEPVELKMKGNFWDTKATIKLNDANVVAMIDRQVWSARAIIGGAQNYCVTIAPNVDMALVVAMCICLDEVNRQ